MAITLALAQVAGAEVHEANRLPQVQVRAGLHHSPRVGEHAFDERLELEELEARCAVERVNHASRDVVLCHVVFRFGRRRVRRHQVARRSCADWAKFQGSSSSMRLMGWSDKAWRHYTSARLHCEALPGALHRMHGCAQAGSDSVFCGVCLQVLHRLFA
ncbi:MAG: hypothetical protein ABJD97_05700 [Betaproteobacteria bacterium]